jgi:hypothetical protein
LEFDEDAGGTTDESDMLTTASKIKKTSWKEKESRAAVRTLTGGRESKKECCRSHSYIQRPD